MPPRKRIKVLLTDSDLEDDAMDVDPPGADNTQGSVPQNVPPIVPFESVQGLPFAKTTPELRQLKLGILNIYKALICIECFKKGDILTVDEATDHAGSHRPPGKRTPTLETIRSVINDHDVHKGALNDIELPQGPLLEMDFLLTELAWLCELCERDNWEVILRSPSVRQKHFATKHPDFTRDRLERQVPAQAFSKHKNRRNFQVIRSNVENVKEPEPLFPETTSEDIIKAYRADWKPLPPRPCGAGGENLKETMPFLVHTGFQTLIENWTPERVALFLELVKPPQSDDPLLDIYEKAVSSFMAGQKQLLNVADCHKQLVMQDDRTNRLTFSRLQTHDSQMRYGRCWGGILVFLARIQRRASRGEDVFGIFLTEQQTTWARKLWRQVEDPGYNRDWDSLLLGASHWLWQGDGPDDFEYMSKLKYVDITMVYAASMCLKPTGMFEEPRQCGHLIAQIKYVIRYTILTWALDERIVKKKKLSWLDEILPMCLDRTQMCPFGEIALLASLCDRYADSSTTNQQIFWSHENKVVTITSKTRVNMDQWRAGIRLFLMETRDFWLQVVFRGIPLAEMGLDITPATRVYDDLSCTDVDYSFVSDDRNPFDQLRFSLGIALLTHPKGGRMHLGATNGKIVWDRKAVNRWLEDLEGGTRMLMSGTHLACGQPDRAVEHALVRSKNVPGRLRSFFFMSEGSIGILSQYNKTTAITGYDRPKLHCVPWFLGEIIVSMLVLAQPLAGYLVEKDLGVDGRYVQEHCGFPLRGREPTGDDLSNDLKRIFKERVGTDDMHARNYRQFANTVEEKFLSYLKKAEHQMITIGDAQSGHNRLTALVHYGVEAGRLMRMAPGDYLNYWGYSMSWASLILKQGDFTPEEYKEIVSLRRRITGEIGPLDYKLLAKELFAEMKEQAPEWLASIGGLQTAAQAEATQGVHQQNTAPLGRAVTQLSAETDPTQPQSETDPAQPQSVEDVTDTLLDELSPAELAARKAPKVTRQHKDVLRLFTGNPKAEWTCKEQAHAFALATSPGRQSLLVVLPTGAGKSILFMGPPLKESGVTVVIFPLRAVLEDQLRIAQRMGIQATIWNRKVGHTYNGLVFASVEQVEGAFIDWCLAIRGKGRLVRVIADECHVVLEAEEYRKAMLNMKSVLQLRVPVILITATIAPCLQSKLLEKFGRPSVRTIRASTQRPNISHHICRYATEDDALEALAQHARRFLAQLLPGEGILIMCRTYLCLDKVTAKLPGCPTYKSSKIQHEREQFAKVAASWLAGEFPLLASTTAMGTGTHHAHCRGVLHLGPGWSVPGVAQGNGRCGRDGLPATTIMFHHGTEVKQPSSPIHAGWSTMEELLTSEDCIRKIESRYLDGPELQVSCFAGPYEVCGNCLRAPDGPVADRPQKIWKRGEVVVASIHQSEEIGEAANESASQREREAREARRRAMSLAAPAAPMASLIERDAQALIDRSLEEDRINNRNADGKELNYALLLRCRRWMINRCALCLITRFDHAYGHDLGACPNNPARNGDLLTYKRQGWNLGDASKKPRDLPTNHTLCFFCFWPLEGHTSDRGRHECSQRYQVKQLCWLLACNSEMWPRLKAYFQLGGEVEDGQSYMRWLYGVHDQGTYRNREFTLINMQRVILWYLAIECGAEFPQA